MGYRSDVAFEEMRSQFEGGDIPGYCTEFIRIGEDLEDVVVERNGKNNQYLLDVHRSISSSV